MTDEILFLITESNLKELTRLIQLHQMLNDGTGLDEVEYDEYENLIESLKDVLPVH